MTGTSGIENKNVLSDVDAGAHHEELGAQGEAGDGSAGDEPFILALELEEDVVDESGAGEEPEDASSPRRVHRCVEEDVEHADASGQEQEDAGQQQERSHLFGYSMFGAA